MDNFVEEYLNVSLKNYDAKIAYAIDKMILEDVIKGCIGINSGSIVNNIGGLPE